MEVRTLTFVWSIYWLRPSKGGFQTGDTSMYPGDLVVNRSIALNEPVIFVSANYRLSGKNKFWKYIWFPFHLFPAFGFLGGKEVKEAGITNAGLYDRRC
jgi:hypothetical protein